MADDPLIQRWFGLRRFAQGRNSLDGMRQVLAALGNPGASLACVQIAGTNGKGSTAAMLSSIAEAAGWRVGLFTSPHLIAPEERFRIDEQDVDPILLRESLADVLDRLAAAEIPALFFEVAVVVAALLFERAGVDLAIFEVGVGGRLDPTTALPAAVSVITSVGLDHTAWLGPDIPSIARAKAGILRPDTPLVLGALPPDAHHVVCAEAHEQGAGPVMCTGRDFTLAPRPDAKPGAQEGLCYVDATATYDDLALGLHGAVQVHNAGLAIAAARLFAQGQPTLSRTKPLSQEAIRRGLAKVRWPGRLQQIQWQGRELWLDGAHNPEAMQRLRQTWDARPTPILVVVCMQDKDVEALLRPWLDRALTLIATCVSQPRALPPAQIAEHARLLGWHGPIDTCAGVPEALALAQQRTTGDRAAATKSMPPILVTGSLFAVGEALALVRESVSVGSR